jgi:hypothetical protein
MFSTIIVLITALLILWLMVEPALAQQERILIAGIGRMSCAYWLSQSVNEGEGWILGFWSRLNYANTRTVGQHTDGEGMIVLSSVNRAPEVSRPAWPQRAGQLRNPEPPARGSPRDLAIGIDAGEIDGPVWSVSDRGTASSARPGVAAELT